MESITVIWSPYHVGIPAHAVGAGPNRLRDQGLVATLRRLPISVIEKIVQPTDAEGDIGRSFDIIRNTSRVVSEVRNASSFPIVVSGNCSASVGVHAGLSGSDALRDEDVGCVWFDAHDDFNIPDTVVSGYFDSQPIAIMAGQCWKALRATVPGYRPLKLDRMVHCGLRDLNDIERARVEEAGYPVVWGGDIEGLDYVTQLRQTMEGREKQNTVVHVDVDCLDMKEGQVNKFEPTSGGLSAGELSQCLAMLPEKTLPASLTVASYDPAYDENNHISSVTINAVTAFVKSLLENKHLLPRKDE